MLSAGCDVRAATREDFEGLSNVFAQENAFHVDLLPEYIAVADPPFRREEFEEALANPDKELFAAVLDGDIVGAAFATVKSAAEMPFLVRRRYAYIMDVVVDEACRGRGVGHELMEAVTAWARDKGVRDIELNVWEANEGAISFYRSLGFEPIDRRMSKRLTSDS